MTACLQASKKKEGESKAKMKQSETALIFWGSCNNSWATIANHLLFSGILQTVSYSIFTTSIKVNCLLIRKSGPERLSNLLKFKASEWEIWDSNARNEALVRVPFPTFTYSIVTNILLEVYGNFLWTYNSVIATILNWQRFKECGMSNFYN